jgi:hypothetical protein
VTRVASLLSSLPITWQLATAGCGCGGAIRPTPPPYTLLPAGSWLVLLVPPPPLGGLGITSWAYVLCNALIRSSQPAAVRTASCLSRGRSHAEGPACAPGPVKGTTREAGLPGCRAT